MKAIRVILWCMVLVAGAFFGYQHYYKSGQLELAQQSDQIFGAPFDLVRHDGQAISDATLKGRNHAIFFGFTHCPDICPAKLVQAHGWMNELGADAEKLDFYFVSVDPERDTAEVLNDYVTSISPHVTGITGEPQKVWDMLKSIRWIILHKSFSSVQMVHFKAQSRILRATKQPLQSCVGFPVTRRKLNL